MTVTPPEEVLTEVPVLTLVVLGEDEREPVNPSCAGTRQVFGRLYHWIERRDVGGRWRLTLRPGIDRAHQQTVIEQQREHNEQVKANKRRALDEERREEEAATEPGLRVVDKRRR